MTNRLIEGFDYLGPNGAVNALLAAAGYTAGGSAQVQTGRLGTGKCFRCGTIPARVASPTLPASAEWVVGFALKYGIASIGTSRNVMSAFEGATEHLRVTKNSTDQLVFNRAGTGLVTNTGFTFASGVWYYIEIKFKIHDTTGYVELHVNGVNQATWSGASTGLDTRNGGTAGTPTIIQIGTDGGSSAGDNYAEYDDWYCNDTGGSAPDNDYWGDTTIEALLPNADGDSSQLVGQDADSTNNYQNVDDADPDDDTTYNQSATVNNKDLYNLGSLLVTSGTVRAVEALAYVKKTEAGSRGVKTALKEGGTETLGAELGLSTSYLYTRDRYATNPRTSSAWAVGDINGAQAGVKVTS